MRVQYTLQALQDLDAIYSFLDEHNPDAAHDIKELLERRIRMLGSFPFMAPLTTEPSVFELSIVDYPYKVYYEVMGEHELSILHIRDTRRRPWRA